MKKTFYSSEQLDNIQVNTWIECHGDLDGPEALYEKLADCWFRPFTGSTKSSGELLDAYSFITESDFF